MVTTWIANLRVASSGTRVEIWFSDGAHCEVSTLWLIDNDPNQFTANGQRLFETHILVQNRAAWTVHHAAIDPHTLELVVQWMAPRPGIDMHASSRYGCQTRYTPAWLRAVAVGSDLIGEIRQRELGKRTLWTATRVRSGGFVWLANEPRVAFSTIASLPLVDDVDAEAPSPSTIATHHALAGTQATAEAMSGMQSQLATLLTATTKLQQQSDAAAAAVRADAQEKSAAAATAASHASRAASKKSEKHRPAPPPVDDDDPLRVPLFGKGPTQRDIVVRPTLAWSKPLKCFASPTRQGNHSSGHLKYDDGPWTVVECVVEQAADGSPLARGGALRNIAGRFMRLESRRSGGKPVWVPELSKKAHRLFEVDAERMAERARAPVDSRALVFDALRGSVYCVELADEQVRRCVAKALRIVVAPGEALYTAGDSSHGAFVVTEGELTLGAGGVLEEVAAGQLVEEHALGGTMWRRVKAASCSIAASGPCVVYEVSRAALEAAAQPTHAECLRQAAQIAASTKAEVATLVRAVQALQADLATSQANARRDISAAEVRVASTEREARLADVLATKDAEIARLKDAVAAGNAAPLSDTVAADEAVVLLQAQLVAERKARASERTRTVRTALHTALTVASASAAHVDLLRKLRRFGFAVVTGCGVLPGTVLQIAHRLGYVRCTNYGKLFNVVAQPAGTGPGNLAYTAAGLSLHTDNPYRDPAPGIQLLHCIQPAAEGGESLVADGFAIAEALRGREPRAFAALVSRAQRFRYVDDNASPPVDLSTERPQIELDVDGRVSGMYVPSRPRVTDCCLDAPHTLPPHAHSLPFPRSFYNNRSAAPTAHHAPEEIERLYAATAAFGSMANSPEFAFKFRLNAGDVLIIDNKRTLHGRTAYAAGAGRFLQGCYIDADQPRSTLDSVERRSAVAAALDGAPRVLAWERKVRGSNSAKLSDLRISGYELEATPLTSSQRNMRSRF